MSRLNERIAEKEKNSSTIIFCWIGLAVLVVLVTIILFRFEPAVPKKIVIATGSKTGAYHAFAKKYAEHFAKNKIKMEILETAGSVENIKLLLSGKADIAMAQGGIKDKFKDTANLRSLGSLYYEPLWVFYTGKQLRLLSELQGKRINIGPDGSGTQAVARKLMDANGITETETTITKMNGKEAANALTAGELDAAFFIASPQAPIIRQLVGVEQVNLMNFRRHRAYARNFGFIKETPIIEGLLDLKRNVPAHDTILLATTATFVTRKDIHPAIVELLLQSARQVHGGRGLIQDANEFPTNQYTEFPLLESAEQNLKEGPSFLSRYLPFWLVLIARRLMLLIIPLLTLLIPIGKGVPLLFHWIAKRKIDKSYGRLLMIEELVSDDSSLLQEAIAEVSEICAQADAMKAPTGYRKDLYQLRWHGARLLEKLDKRTTEEKDIDDGNGAEES